MAIDHPREENQYTAPSFDKRATSLPRPERMRSREPRDKLAWQRSLELHSRFPWAPLRRNDSQREASDWVAASCLAAASCITILRHGSAASRSARAINMTPPPPPRAAPPEWRPIPVPVPARPRKRHAPRVIPVTSYIKHARRHEWICSIFTGAWAVARVPFVPRARRWSSLDGAFRGFCATLISWKKHECLLAIMTIKRQRVWALLLQHKRIAMCNYTSLLAV